MAFHIKNPETDALARELAALKRTSLTKAVHVALENELALLEANSSRSDAAANSKVDISES